ncbi:MAG: DUF11 domain-containing protein [Flavobacteriales bacterium]|nr:DUF11 domain-containing protein [Flavobacteriales bacterium]
MQQWSNAAHDPDQAMTNMMTRACFLLLLLVPSLSKAISVSIWQYGPSLCGNNNGYATASVSGGTPPYTYLWSNGANTEEVQGLAPGTYSVTVTDALLDEATAQVTILIGENTIYTAFSGAGLHGCKNLCNGGRNIHEDAIPANLVQPLSFWPPLDVDNGGPVGGSYGQYTTLCPGQILQFFVTDATGCELEIIDTWYPESSDPSPMGILGVTPTCSGMPTGTVTIHAGIDDTSPFASLWDVVILNESMQQVGGPIGGLNTTQGQNIATRPGLAPGNYYAKRYFTWHPAACQDMVPFTITDLGTDCGILSGTAFVDNDLNCTRQTNEPFVPGMIMEVLPGPYYATTSGNGQYSFTLPSGSYTVQQQSSTLGEHCVGTPIPFTINAGAYTTVHHADTSLVPLDVSVSLSSGAARPGFEFQYGMLVRNHTPSSSGAISTSFTFDPTVSFIAASPAPTTVVGNTLTWNQAELTAWQSRYITIRFQVPPDVGLLGYELVANAIVSTANSDSDLTNNSATNLRTITGAYDPNDKLAYTSNGNTSVWQINEDQWIDYTIRFQNTGTDTAFNVVITDTLPPNLDPGTLVMGSASHSPFSWELRGESTLRVFFPNILLPDSNFSEPLSHGFVGFRIRPRLPLLPGDEITNIANIYFDFNPPVITEPSVLVATTGTGVEDPAVHRLAVHPNPVTDHLQVRVQPDAPRVHRVFAADGQEVHVTGTWSNDVFMLEVTQLSPGLYLIQLGGGTARFVKQ